MLQNTTYIDDTMGNSTHTSNDHFWNIGVDEDGHHRAVSMERYANTYTGAPTSPDIPTGMDSTTFTKTIGSEPALMFRNLPYLVPGVEDQRSVMQLLGIRAYAVFNYVAGGDATVQTLICSFNVTSVLRQGNSPTFGRYSVNYSTALSNANYMLLGGGIAGGLSTPCTFSASGATLGNKTGSQGLFLLYSGTTATTNAILQGWVIAFGGYN
jgi:hypothetical protein